MHVAGTKKEVGYNRIKDRRQSFGSRPEKPNQKTTVTLKKAGTDSKLNFRLPLFEEPWVSPVGGRTLAASFEATPTRKREHNLSRTGHLASAKVGSRIRLDRPYASFSTLLEPPGVAVPFSKERITEQRVIVAGEVCNGFKRSD